MPPPFFDNLPGSGKSGWKLIFHEVCPKSGCLVRELRLQEPGRWAYADVPEPTAPGPGEVLVRVHRVGICGTDYHAYRGRQPFFEYPRRLGHELGVEIVAVGTQVSTLRPGDRCAVEPYLNCRTCSACRREKSNCCERLRVLGVHTDGGFTEYLLLPADKLHPSATLGYEELALVETLAIGAHAVSRAGVTPEDTVLVVGAGPIGLACLQFAKRTGARTGVLDLSETRLAFARDVLRADAAMPGGDGQESRIRDAFGGEWPTVVLDATGNPASMARAFEVCAHGGRITFVGLFQGDLSFNDPNFHRRELTVLASRNALPADFRQIISGMEAGTLDTRPWITHRVPFGSVADAFEALLDPTSGVVKAMIELESAPV